MAAGAQAPSPVVTQQSNYRRAPAQEETTTASPPEELKSIKCPSCGAPISPKFGEMVITCEYCGTSVSLGKDGWKNIQKHTMLPLKYADKNAALALAHDMMDKGLLRRHLQESSTLEEATLSVVPFWIIPASARTSIVATDMAAEAGSIATIAALMGVMGGGRGRRLWWRQRRGKRERRGLWWRHDRGNASRKHDGWNGQWWWRHDVWRQYSQVGGHGCQL